MYIAPWVITISYGDTESSITTSYATRVSTEFQKYGLTGRSIIFASGGKYAPPPPKTTHPIPIHQTFLTNE